MLTQLLENLNYNSLLNTNIVHVDNIYPSKKSHRKEQKGKRLNFLFDECLKIIFVNRIFQFVKFNLSGLSLERIKGRQVMERPKNKQTVMTGLRRSTVWCDATKAAS